MRKGFTLIELIMVIVIIGILAAVAIPRFIDLRSDAQQAACQGSAAAIQTAISNFYARSAISGTAAFPTDLHDSGFTFYLAQGTLPANPYQDWSTYYDSSSGVLDVTQACQ